MFNKVTIAPLVGVLFSILALLHVVLPASVTQESVTIFVAGVITVITVFGRFFHGDAEFEGIKSWWQSKVIWTQIVGVLAGGAALVFPKLNIDVGSYVQAIMLVVSLVTVMFGAGTGKAIK